MRALALTVVLAAAAPGALAAQSTTHAGVRAAIEAYDAGEFGRALSLLESLPASLPGPDQAVRLIYSGLIYFARGEAASASVAFEQAVRADPAIRLDPDRHSPNRVDAFQRARDAVVRAWRADARSAEARGDTVQAMRHWTAIAAAAPADIEAAERLIALRRAQRDPSIGQAVELPTAADEPVRPSAARVLDPGRAALLGLLVPGLGEIYTGRTGRGALILTTSAAALGVGLFVEKVTVDCLSLPVDGICPTDNIAGERRERPYVVPGVGFAVVATLLGAVDAALAADRTSYDVGGSAAPGAGARLRAPRLRAEGARLRLDLIRIGF